MRTFSNFQSRDYSPTKKSSYSYFFSVQ